ncbi:hypothetical protein F4861DRAFT_54860 [Xylaria intraflava]|nr:hypothetical protein F4861DRAFT_54860 [Xylaria intraflava]
MAVRKVIADSEDEDEGEDEPVPYSEGDCVRPEPELLSPHHRPSSPVVPDSNKPPPDVTDASFFTEIYTDQQSLAAQQSYLIENIVRQSQKASASSGDVSLPPMKLGGKANPSSGTDVTSPLVLNGPRNNRTLVSEGVSEFTTPLKIASQVWDIPSSAENTRSREKTYAKSKGPMHKAPIEDGDGDYQPYEVPRTSPAPTPAVKRAKLSHHDPILPSTATFYIAQSNLTTMEKLEYQKVHVPTNGYGGLPGPLPNPKSSYASTIPYSTPSGYSPVTPRWKEFPAAPSPQEDNVINISSSPDVIASGFDSPDGMQPDVDPEFEIPASNKSRESRGRRRSRTLSSKGKEAAAKEVEEDELCQDNTWDPGDIDLPRECYKPRPTKRRAAAAAELLNIKTGTETLEEVSEGAAIHTLDVFKPATSSLMDTDPLDPPPGSPPKKRRRKKKADVEETSPTEAEKTEVSYLERDPDPSSEETEVDVLMENPKKQRGRLRKTKAQKGAEKTSREPPMAEEPPRTHSPRQDDDLEKSTTTTRKAENGGKKAKGKNNKPIEIEASDSDTELEESRVPLKEVDGNAKAPSEPLSARETPPKAVAPKNEKLATESQPKETTRLAAAQSKAIYRVGLSKRSRIAPLLKTIRK